MARISCSLLVTGEGVLTQDPQLSNRLSYSPAAAVRAAVPMSVRIVATIGIMWGLLQLVCNGMSLPAYLVAEHDDAMAQMMASHGNLFAFLLVATVSRVALGIVLVIGSAAALGLKPFGRQAMLVFAVGAILITLAELGVAIAYPEGITPPPATAADGQTVVSQRPHALVIAFSIVVSLIYPAVVLIFMNQSHVKAAFKGN